MAIRLLSVAVAVALGMAAPAAQAMFLAFTPDPARAGAPLAEGGCASEPGLARGALTSSPAAETCHSGLVGSFTGGDPPEDAVATFETGDLAAALPVGGPGTMVVYYTAPASPWVGSAVEYHWREKHASGTFTRIAVGYFAISGHGNAGVHREERAVEVPAYTLSPGSRLQLVLFAPPANGGSAEARIVFGGEFSDAGITFHTNAGADPGTDPGTGPDTGPPDPDAEPNPLSEPEAEPAASSGSGGGGSMPIAILLPLLGVGALRRRRARAFARIL